MADTWGGMIHLVDRAVERFFRQEVPLPESSVDVSFDAPDRTWGAAVTRPTINIFLWGVTRNPAFAQAGMLSRTGINGIVERRPKSPVVDLHYLITTWATEQRDEHQLLGSVLTCVLGNSVLPVEMLPEQMAETSWVSLSLAAHEKNSPGEFWSALDGRLKPGLEIELSLPLDVFTWAPTAPMADSINLSLDRLTASNVTQSDKVPLRRHRAGGALVMEGRPVDPSEPDIGSESADGPNGNPGQGG
ncbi:MAG: DUF4255 domain-containing protein [Actinomycetota bacterium]|nr:DUF4255 domain-containing protein [Actinomycetota bacterium]